MGAFTVACDAKALHEDFPMLSLTAHEERWEDSADEVATNLLAVAPPLQANTVTLIGEEAFAERTLGHSLCLPVTLKVRGGPH